MDQNNYPNLFSPIQIGPMKLKNRIVMPPMGSNLGNPQQPGYVSERHMSYYTERARGEAGLLIMEGAGVVPSKSFRKSAWSLHDDQFIPGFQELVKSIQGHGAKCAIQIAALGRLGNMKVDPGGKAQKYGVKPEEYYAVSALAHPMTGIVPKALNHGQIENIVQCFFDAGKRAKKAGFDAVELHGAHGYLLNEFLSPYSNKRNDAYGGDIEGRATFPLQVVRAVREAIGDDLALSYRMSVDEFVEGGLDIAESIVFAKMLEKEGVQILHVSAGLNESPSAMNRVIPPMSYPRGRLVPYAAKMKEALNIPVIVVQRINTPDLAEEIIREGAADLIATGRGFIADPHWPLKAKEGRSGEIRRCIACNQGCIERLIMEKSITCLYNPEVGYESHYRPFKKKGKAKNILVIGGGIAGMEAAYILALKGYKVKLVEKDNRLGGCANLASVLETKKEFGGVVEFLQNQLTRLHVDIHLNEEVNSDEIDAGLFDDIIVASGSRPIIPKIALESTCEIRLAKDVLQNPEGVGENVVIVGGGSVGIETAEYLCGLGKKVTVIEMLDTICGDLGPNNKADILERIADTAIELKLNTEVLEFVRDGIRTSEKGGETVLECYDTTVIAAGIAPQPIASGDNSRMHFVGDCKQIGNAMDAIHDAFHLAMGL